MKLSSKTHYGLMACHILGLNHKENLVSATTLESKIGVSSKYIEKIMRTLTSRNIVEASRGANGGYFLKREPKDITVGEIVRALEDDMEIIECVKSNKKCKCCPSQAVWQKLYDGINDLLDSITLQQVIDGNVIQK